MSENCTLSHNLKELIHSRNSSPLKTNSKNNVNSPSTKHSTPESKHIDFILPDINIKKNAKVLHSPKLVSSSEKALKKDKLKSKFFNSPQKNFPTFEFKNLYLNNDKERELLNELEYKSNVKGYYFKSRPGNEVGGASKINQDNYLVCSNVLSLDNYHIFGVFDGHGVNGDLVSNTAKKFFKDYFNNSDLYFDKNSNITTVFDTVIYEKLKENNYELIKSAFQNCHNKLKIANYNTNMSGTTATLTFIIGNKIICACVGDSRGTIVLENKEELISLQISKDHKPDLYDEKARIVKSGGCVAQLLDEYGNYSGPYRVFMKNEGFPGLAMSRSLGDMIAHSVGCTCIPEITEFNINKSLKYMVLASDGVWEFLNNEDVMELVNPFYNENNIEEACSTLIKESVKHWKKEDEVIDDITTVIVYF